MEQRIKDEELARNRELDTGSTIDFNEPKVGKVERPANSLYTLEPRYYGQARDRRFWPLYTDGCNINIYLETLIVLIEIRFLIVRTRDGSTWAYLFRQALKLMKKSNNI